MKQSSFRYLGVFDLLVVAVLVAVFGVRAFTASVVAPAMALAGVAALVAGSVAAVSVGPVAVTWRQFVGLKYALLAAMLPGSYLPAVLAGTASRTELALFAVASVGGLSLLFFGYEVTFGGDHVEIDPDVETVVGR